MIATGSHPHLPALQPIFAHHTSPEQASSVFARAKPKLAVYSHIVRLGDAKASPPSDAETVQQTRRAYVGPLVVGVDQLSGPRVDRGAWYRLRSRSALQGDLGGA